MEKTKKSSKLLYLNLIWLALWPVLIWLYADFRIQQKDKIPEGIKEVRQEGYKFINPLLECEFEQNHEIKKHIPFENKLKQRINDEVLNQNPDMNIAIYFRNLNNGPWIGINEDENFKPVSLLKVPIMIVWLKEIEEDSNLAKRTFIYEKSKGPSDIYQYVPPEVRMEEGKAYSVEELLRRMIVDSDNEAMYILKKNIPSEKIIKVYKDLSVDYLVSEAENNFISVKEYASFFRILYNSAYLNRESSEKALEILSQVKFKEGLVEGIGNNIIVAHKFGEFDTLGKDNKNKQLHDCGIVYYSKYPYLLCVMTRGGSYENLTSAIQNIAKITQEIVRISYPE